ncbi:MAG: hypothetical protein QXY87_14230 [Saccharolobus sp.]
MYDYRLVKIDKNIHKRKNIVLLTRELLFNKFSVGDEHFKVLVSDKRKELGISKSYYYYILSQLRGE